MSFIKIAFSSFSMSRIEIAKISISFYLAKYWKSAAPMNAKSSSLVSSINDVSLEVIAGLRIRLASTMYFSFLLSASLLMLWYADRTLGMAGKISSFFDFFDFLTFLTFETLQEQLH